MSNASLAARYRPQTFAQVVGQDMVKTVLSRAALEDRVAPAYLLSGTRGVGKTTIARIFAKALNCAQAPTGEPCNQCEACRRITQGSFVDVVEIDGASNRGIDDVRRLRDAVGYAAMEGRYKVFIIDEAHMLTKEAFNALLKTLEEPPPRVTFIMATTEQHKFPVTIVSRCQHFVFRHIPEAALEAHLLHVLGQEGLPYDAEAPRLIAHRAAGSVRDAMSLLGQALAFSQGQPLTEERCRNVLGLAGQDIMDRLLRALAAHDAAVVAALVRELLGQGADLGFFLRELSVLWRNLFLLHQIGHADGLDMPEREKEYLLGLAPLFSLTYIHAAWQMTLEGQRRILTSLEPAAALELLLLNLALLPRILPLPELAAPETPAPLAGQAAAAPPASPSPSASGAAAPPVRPAAVASSPVQEPPAVSEKKNESLSGKSWEDFLAFCEQHPDCPLPPAQLRLFQAELKPSPPALVLSCSTDAFQERLSRAENAALLRALLQEWAGCPVALSFTAPAQGYKSQADRRKEVEEHPVIVTLKEQFDAVLLPTRR